MRIVLLSAIILAAGACASQPPAPAPVGFERVADRLNPSQSLLGLGLPIETRVEIEADRNPVDRRDGLLVATAIGDLEVQRSIDAAAATATGQAPDGEAQRRRDEARDRLNRADGLAGPRPTEYERSRSVRIGSLPKPDDSDPAHR